MAPSRIKHLDSLPPLPYVAHEILLAVNDGDESITKIAAALAREPGLTARLVAMANSAFCGNQRPVYSPEEAVVRLGLNRVRVLAASVLLAKQFDSARCPAFRAERYWFDAVGTAFCAARVARPAGLAHAEDAAYLAGLLHNIGLLLLVYVFPDEMNRVLETHGAAPDESLVALTRKALGTEHHEAGRLLLAEWGLPEEIVDAAGHVPGQQNRGPHRSLIALVEFCSRWTAATFDTLPPIPAELTLDVSRLDPIAEACRRESEQLQAFARLLATA